MARSNDIRNSDLLILISQEVGGNATPEVARRYLSATYKVILAELKLNKRIFLKNFGAFETFETGGGDKKMGVPTGGTMIRYIHPRTKVKFKPSAVFERYINQDDYKIPPNKRNKKPKAQVKMEHNERRRKPQPTVEDLVTEMLNKK